MAVKPTVDLPVHWNLSVQPDGTGRLAFAGELDAESTPMAWRRLESELASIYSVANRVVVLDPKTRGIAAEGYPSWLRENASPPWVRQFLNREAA